jgi:hypothetical protein
MICGIARAAQALAPRVALSFLFVRRPLLSNKKRNYILTTGETQKEAQRTCKTTDYGQLTTDT